MYIQRITIPTISIKTILLIMDTWDIWVMIMDTMIIMISMISMASTTVMASKSHMLAIQWVMDITVLITDMVKIIMALNMGHMIWRNMASMELIMVQAMYKSLIMALHTISMDYQAMTSTDPITVLVMTSMDYQAMTSTDLIIV